MFEVGEINIICSDGDRSLKFYRDVLGFEVVSQEDDAYHMRCGLAKFLLLPVAGAAPKAAPYCSVPAFSVDLMTADIESAVQHFNAAHVEFANKWKPGDSRVFIRDPDGLVFEVIQKK